VRRVGARGSDHPAAARNLNGGGQLGVNPIGRECTATAPQTASCYWCIATSRMKPLGPSAAPQIMASDKVCTHRRWAVALSSQVVLQTLRLSPQTTVQTLTLMVGGHVQGPCKPSKQEIQDQQDGTFVVVYVLAMSGKYKLEAVLGSTLINSFSIPCNQRAAPSSLHLRVASCLYMG